MRRAECGGRGGGGHKGETRSLSTKCFFRHIGAFLLDFVFTTLLWDLMSAIKYLFNPICTGIFCCQIPRGCANRARTPQKFCKIVVMVLFFLFLINFMILLSKNDKK